MNELKSCLIGDVAEIIGGGTPSTKNEENFGGDIAWITPKDLSDHDAMYISKGERSITTIGLENSSAKLLPANSILFTSRAPIGYVALAKNEITTNQGFKSLVLKDDNDPKFFYYLLKNITPQIKSYASGSTFQEISGKVLSAITIKIPNANIQKKIGEFLEKFDKKIELNKKSNETLEDIAKALFKSWFVDFDPVRAKAESRSTGLPNAISDLFPNSFEDCELGPIPSGSRLCLSSDLYNVSIGKTPPRKESWWFSKSTNDIPWISIKDMGNSSVYTSETSEFLTEDAVKKFNVKVVPEDTVIVSFKLTVGRVLITHNKMLTNEAIAHFISKKSPIPSSYTYCLFSIFDFRSLGSTSSIATAVNSKMLREMQIIDPPYKCKQAFDQICNPLFQKIKRNLNESKALEEIKDAMLPKLFSGEIRISEAEKILDEAGI